MTGDQRTEALARLRAERWAPLRVRRASLGRAGRCTRVPSERAAAGSGRLHPRADCTPAREGSARPARSSVLRTTKRPDTANAAVARERAAALHDLPRDPTARTSRLPRSSRPRISRGTEGGTARARVPFLTHLTHGGIKVCACVQTWSIIGDFGARALIGRGVTTVSQKTLPPRERQLEKAAISRRFPSGP
jgi:hypothetical protein